MIERWIQDYVHAWRSDDPDAVAALFTEDARYFTEPYRMPKEGRDTIVRWWVDQGDSKLDWSFEYSVVAESGDVHVVRGVTHYPPECDAPSGKTYQNLWIVKLASNGRAREFTEWWMLEPAADEGAHL